MIDVNKALKIAKDSTSQTRLMSNNLRRSIIKSRISSDKLFRQEVKIQKLREEAFLSLKNSLRERERRGGGGLLGAAIGLGGVGGLGRRFRGGGGGLRGGGSAPKLPRGPLAKGLSKFGRIGPMAIASTGLDFFLRKQGGQSNLQAGGGALAGLGGFAGGAKIGATLGTFVAPGVGTAVGGLLGGAIGGLVGGNLFDRLYGQNIIRAGADLRRVREEELSRQSKTLFGENLDKFDVVLGKFAKVAPNINQNEDTEEAVLTILDKRLPKRTTRLKKTGAGKIISELFFTLIDVASIALPGLSNLKTVKITKQAKVLDIIKQRKNSKLLEFLQFQKNVPKASPKTPIDVKVIDIKKIIDIKKVRERLQNLIKLRQTSKNNELLKFLRFQKLIPRVPSPTRKEDILRRMAQGYRRNFGRSFEKNVRRTDKLQQIKLRNAQKKDINKNFGTTREFKLDDFLKQYKLPDPFKLRREVTETFRQNVEDLLILRDRGVINQKQFDLAKKLLDERLALTDKVIGNYADRIKSAFDKGVKPNLNQLELFKEKAVDFIGIDITGILSSKDTGMKVIKRFLKNKSRKKIIAPKSLSNEEGGKLLVKGPDSGYILPLILHGNEELTVVPKENRFTKSRGQVGGKQQVVLIGGGGKGSPIPSQTRINGGGQMGVIQTSEKVDPFAAASKYSTLIGCMTV